MTDLSKLTAKDFSDAMHKGWGGRRWCDMFFFQKKGRAVFFDENPPQCCAIGAISLALNVEPHHVIFAMDKSYPGLKSEIVEASDHAGNKRAAMKAVDAILLKVQP